jgi:hypothetical protein
MAGKLVSEGRLRARPMAAADAVDDDGIGVSEVIPSWLREVQRGEMPRLQWGKNV